MKKKILLIVLFLLVVMCFNEDVSATTEWVVGDEVTLLVDVEVADMDNDGNLDMVAVYGEDPKLVWYESNGNGTFTEQVIVASFGLPIGDFALADLDNDGDIDIVVAYGTWNVVSVYYNDRDGTFTRVDLDQVLSLTHYIEVVIADLNSDGYLDIITVEDESTIVWFKNNKNGTFEGNAALYWSLQGITSIEATDIDHDGDDDIVFNLNGSPDNIVWLDNLYGDGTVWDFYEVPVYIEVIVSVHAADMDNDGDIDILSSARDSGDIILNVNTRDSAGMYYLFTDDSHPVVISGADASDLYTVDMDCDGLLDILTASTSGNSVNIYINNGDGTYTENIENSIESTSPTKVITGDMDNDGDEDVLVVSSNGDDNELRWYENDFALKPLEVSFETYGGSAVEPIEQLSVDPIFTSQSTVHDVNYSSRIPLLSVDLDNDGDMDIVHGYFATGTIRWSANDGSGVFTDQGNLSTSVSGISDIFAVDVDRDGDMDILSAAKNSDTIAWHENDGSESFTTNIITTSADGAGSVYGADMDNDGDIDVVVASREDDTIAWFENDGANIFTEHVITTLVDAVEDIDVADLDNDGDLDILAAINFDDTFSWYMNNGDQTFTEQTSFSTSADGAMTITTADIDNDGDQDVIGGSYLDDTIELFLNNGDGTFTEQASITTSLDGIYDVVGVDFNNDGYIDVLSQGFFDDVVVWYLNNGDGTFTQQEYVTTIDDGAECVFAADLDRDGDMDIISNSFYTGTTYVYDNTSGFTSEITAPEDPSKEGHTFHSWYLDDTYTIPYTFDVFPSEDTVLYARWTINIYTVEFLDYDGTVLQTANYDYGTDLSGVTLPSDPVRTGHTFSGWDEVLPATLGAAAVIITAEYDINQYTVEFVNHNGTILQTADYDYLSDLSGVAAPVDPVQTGHTFTGWDMDVPSTMGTENITITATYSINQYTITFYSFDGGLLDQITFDYGSDLAAVVFPTPPEVIGYTFDSWIGVLPDTMPDTNLGILSQYNVNQYSIEFVDFDETILKTLLFDYGTDLSEEIPPSDPERIGYTFDGWDDVVPATMGAELMTINALYTINSYTLTFNTNGANTISAITEEFNTTISSPDDPVKAGYAFGGWYIDEWFEIAFVFTNMPAENFTLYASWVDVEAPVISVIASVDVNQSEIDEFTLPLATVTDNEDDDIQVSITYFKADGETVLTDFDALKDEIENGNNVLVKYNAIDANMNEATEVTLEIISIDDGIGGLVISLLIVGGLVIIGGGIFVVKKFLI